MTNKPGRTVYVDMDGVLADFLTAALRLFIKGEKVIVHLQDTWPVARSIHEMLGIKVGPFWDQINKQGCQFWSTLPMFMWTNRLLACCQAVGDTLILSSPSLGGNSAYGKTVWIETNLPRMHREFVLTPKKHKWRLARPGDILIDDTLETCHEWEDAGGIGIVFPSPINGHAGWRDPLNSGVLAQLQIYEPKKEIK